MSTDLHTLTGVYAIDALSVEEADEFTAHLRGCESCRAEVLELQDAAARMGASEAILPPPALKARVLAAADQISQLPPKVTSINEARSRRWYSRLSAAAAAVVLVVGAGFTITQIRDQQQAQTSTMAASVTKVLSAPDVQTRKVETSNGGDVTLAASAQLGRAAVETNRLPTLSSSKVYQLWTLRGSGRATSVAVLTDPGLGKAFDLPTGNAKVAITIEPQGGSAQPTTTPIVAVKASAV